MTNPVVDATFPTDIPNCYMVADPFIAYNPDTSEYVLFFEAQWDDGVTPNVGVGNATGYATSSDGLTWTYQGKLTGIGAGNYNMAFRVDDDEGNLQGWFMLPHDDGKLKLYQAVTFPNVWQFAKTLAVTPECRDATIFQFQNNWYILFSGVGSTPLYLYTSSDLLNVDFTEHPSSPLQTGSDKCRPGGRPIIRSDSVDVFVQKNDVTYGQRVRAYRLTNLTPTTCTITELATSPLLSESGTGWNADGMHNLDRVNSGLSLVDGKYLDGSGNDVWAIGIYRDVP